MNYAESLRREERSFDLLQEKNEKNIHPPQGPSLYGGDAT